MTIVEKIFIQRLGVRLRNPLEFRVLTGRQWRLEILRQYLQAGTEGRG